MPEYSLHVVAAPLSSSQESSSSSLVGKKYALLSTAENVIGRSSEVTLLELVDTRCML